MADKKAKERKVDVFAQSKGSLAERLKRRRQMMEGDVTEAYMGRMREGQSTDSNNK